MAGERGGSHAIRERLAYLATPEHAASVREESAQLAAGIASAVECGDCGAPAGTPCRDRALSVCLARHAAYVGRGAPPAIA